MFNNAFKFNFGSCENDPVKFSMYGIAVRNNTDTWVSYNKQTGEIVDVDVFSFEGGEFLYKIPVSLNSIEVGDVIIHNRVPVVVLNKLEGDRLSVIDVRAGEEKVILPAKSIFGFDFVTKVVSIFDLMQTNPNPSQPFGNILPFLFLSNEQGDKNTDLMVMLMAQSSQNGQFSNINPMMFYALAKNDKIDSNILPLILMMGGGLGNPANSQV